MVCYHPLVGKYNPEKNGQFFPCLCKYKAYVAGIEDPERVLLPCGKCGYCCMRRAVETSVRIMHEYQTFSDEASFLTLTYDEKHILECPLFHYKSFWLELEDHLDELFLEDEEREFCNNSGSGRSLVRKHVVDFIKRLRRHCDYQLGKKIRVFYCGEYGSKFGRPHFHLIVLGHAFHEDREFWKKSGSNSLFVSSSLAKLWPKGFSLIGDVSHESCAYVSRYSMKKMPSFEKSFIENSGRSPEFFSFRSTTKGIGYDFFQKYWKEIYYSDLVYYECNAKGKTKIRKIRPPRYYDKLLAIKDPDMYSEIKKTRMENAPPEVSYESLAAIEENFKARMSPLIREIDEQKLVM